MEGSIVHAFETSCKAMFDQVDATFQNGLQQQVDSTHSPLAVSLRVRNFDHSLSLIFLLHISYILNDVLMFPGYHQLSVIDDSNLEQ